MDDSAGLRGSAVCGHHGGPGCSATATTQHGTTPSPRGGGPTSPTGSGSGLRLVAQVSCTSWREHDAEQEWTCSAGSIPAPAAPVFVDPRTVAEQARATMTLPSPNPTASPGFDADTVVGFPVWLWADPASWEPVSATAEVSAGSVTVTATPDRATWHLGDGTTLTCEGPGTVHDPDRHDPISPSPDCGHTYTRASHREPGGEFPVTTTVVWTVTWSTTTGDGGTLDPLTTTARRAFTVREVHALVTN
ncbi:hypothetical protein [Nocardiopsis protaetiae]|uniref:hypothetical protein n=1 Tax=Nocardiopsis protaetiae TaxID=3382270 RepID=UPI00387B7233